MSYTMSPCARDTAVCPCRVTCAVQVCGVARPWRLVPRCRVALAGPGADLQLYTVQQTIHAPAQPHHVYDYSCKVYLSR